MGYHRAGFDVVGVDLNPQPNYPFEFHQGDAMTWPLDGFDVVHASPPCQDHSSLKSLQGGHGTAWMLPATRQRLREWGGIYVIENVVGADMPGAITLCGSEFGLSAVCKGDVKRQLRRHRLFESNVPLRRAGGCAHDGVQPVGVYGNGGGGAMTRGYKGTKDERREAMGIDWMSHKEIAQAIPPAYTEHIGLQLIMCI
jgi:DNA (cytosine-5)-methyltransferase 1